MFDPNGITETLDTVQGGGRMAHTINVIGKLNENRATDANGLGIDGISGTLLASDYKGPKMVGIPNFIPTENDTSKTLRTGGKGSLTAKHAYDLVAIGASRGRNPENTSDRTTGAPTGQRFEINEDGVSNTLTTVQKDNLVCMQSDVMGVIDDQGRLNKAVSIKSHVPTLRAQTKGNLPKVIKQNPFRIRKLTPKECWRLQGFEDWQFDLAKADGVSDSQLYKQAGNAVSVVVAKAVGDAIMRSIKEAKK